MLIGKGGVGVDAIKAELNALVNRSVNINIIEVRNPDANAQLVAENIRSGTEKRTSFRRAMKQSSASAMKAGAKGIKIKCGGRPAARKSRVPRVTTKAQLPPDHPCRH